MPLNLIVIAIEDVFLQELRYELGKRYLNNELCFP